MRIICHAKKARVSKQTIKVLFQQQNRSLVKCTHTRLAITRLPKQCPYTVKFLTWFELKKPTRAYIPHVFRKSEHKCIACFKTNQKKCYCKKCFFLVVVYFSKHSCWMKHALVMFILVQEQKNLVQEQVQIPKRIIIMVVFNQWVRF